MPGHKYDEQRGEFGGFGAISEKVSSSAALSADCGACYRARSRVHFTHRNAISCLTQNSAILVRTRSWRSRRKSITMVK